VNEKFVWTKRLLTVDVLEERPRSDRGRECELVRLTAVT
jgi:hypothetical protein